MNKERFEELKEKYFRARKSLVLMKEFIQDCTDVELAEMRLYVLDNLLEPKMIDIIERAGHSIEEYKAEQRRIINEGGR